MILAVLYRFTHTLCLLSMDPGMKLYLKTVCNRRPTLASSLGRQFRITSPEIIDDKRYIPRVEWAPTHEMVWLHLFQWRGLPDAIFPQ